MEDDAGGEDEHDRVEKKESRQSQYCLATYRQVNRMQKKVTGTQKELAMTLGRRFLPLLRLYGGFSNGCPEVVPGVARGLMDSTSNVCLPKGKQASPVLHEIQALTTPPRSGGSGGLPICRTALERHSS